MASRYCLECGVELETDEEIDDGLCEDCAEETEDDWDDEDEDELDTAHIHYHKPTLDPRYFLCECGDVATERGLHP